jgi:single-strand DNA-binding protein
MGFLGADVEIKSTSGRDIAVLSIATKSSWKTEAGAWESRTEWHRCVGFNAMARAAAELKKGAHLLVEGELRSREYDREVSTGSQVATISQRVWEIRIDQVISLDRRTGSDANDPGRNSGPVGHQKSMS